MPDLHTIERELVELGQAAVSRWQRMAILMIEVDESEAWKAHEGIKSFSAWVRWVAGESGVHESVLWRALNAGRFYLKTREARPSMPQLEDADGTSAVGLELLGRITRYAPEDVRADLTERFLAGEVTNAELRQVWNAYSKAKPATETARGRGQSTPSTPDPKALTAAQVITSLRSFGPEWIPGATLDCRYAIFDEVPVRPGSSRHARRIDVVAVLQCPFKPLPQLHGIEVKVTASDLRADTKLTEYASFVHALWVAAPSDVDPTPYLPEQVGILAVGDGYLRVIREATRPVDQPDLVAETAQTLLTRVLDRSAGWDHGPKDIAAAQSSQRRK